MIRSLIGGFLLVLLPLAAMAQEISIGENYVNDTTKTRTSAIRPGFYLGLESGVMRGTANPSQALMTKYAAVTAPWAIGASAAFGAQVPLSKLFQLRGVFGLTLLPTQIKYDEVGPGTPLTVQFMYLSGDVGAQVHIGHFYQARAVNLIVGGYAEINAFPEVTSRVNPTPVVPRIELGLSYPMRVGESVSRVELLVSHTLQDALGDGTEFERWWNTASRIRVSARIYLF
jgi:hypothetical protein